MSQTPRNTFQFVEIVDLVSQQTGLTFPENRQSSIDAAIKRAMKRLGVADVPVYIEILTRGGIALDDLLSELTVGETYFFREPAQLGVLREEVIPRLMSGKNGHRRSASQGIRAWSAACASGEEAYSLAIMLQEDCSEVPYTVLGTDLARARLSSARRARYRRWSLRGMTDNKISHYFRTRGDQYELLPQFRQHVEFQYLNLAEDVYPAISTGVWGMDIILCRNVLIYFDRDTVARVGTRLLESLSDEGWLLLGASDPVLSDLVRCEVVQTTAGLLYRKAGVADRKVIPGLLPKIQYTHRTLHIAPLQSTPVQSVDAGSTPASPSPVPSLQTTQPETTYPVIVPWPVESVVTNEHADVVVDDTSGDGRTLTPSQGAIVTPATAEEAVIALIRDLANRGCLEEAGRECASALDRYRLSSELLYLHAVLLAQAGRSNDSAAAARRALYLDRNMIVAYLALATAHARMGTSDSARRALKNAEKLLMALSPDVIVPASDGESAGRLLAMVRVQHALLTKAA